MIPNRRRFLHFLLKQGLHEAFFFIEPMFLHCNSHPARNRGLNVASERQIAANRQNARKSTGPRSSATKKRVAQNAYRHGLAVSSGSLTTFARRLNRLARKIAGNTSDETILEQARIVAQAELDLVRVRWAKVALIERAAACENIQPSRLLGRDGLKAIQLLNTLRQPIESATMMAPPKRDRSAEAIRRVPSIVEVESIRAPGSCAA
jgi:hypothetical protein